MFNFGQFFIYFFIDLNDKQWRRKTCEMIKRKKRKALDKIRKTMQKSIKHLKEKELVLSLVLLALYSLVEKRKAAILAI